MTTEQVLPQMQGRAAYGAAYYGTLPPDMDLGCTAYGDAVSPTWTFVGGLAKGTGEDVLNHVGQEGMLLFWTWTTGPAWLTMMMTLLTERKPALTYQLL